MTEKITVAQLFEALIEYKYVVFKDGNIIVTQDFYQDFGDPKRFQTNLQIKQAASMEISPPTLGIDIPVTRVEVSRFEDTPLVKFIIDAKVPEKMKTKTGTYYINKFNTKAEKILMKILKENIDYSVLVASAFLYYKSGVMVKTIANYFIEGIWKDEYNKLADKINGGDVSSYMKQAMKEGIVNEEGASSYRRR